MFLPRFVGLSVCKITPKVMKFNENFLGERDFGKRNNPLDYKLIRTWIKEFGFTFFNVATVITTQLTAMGNPTITGHDTLQSEMPLPKILVWNNSWHQHLDDASGRS